MAVFWFEVPLRGSVVLLFAVSVIYVLCTLALGLFISTISDTQQQAMMTTADAPVELPPAIVATKAYRCKDNSLVYIDWLSDGTARVKKDRNEVGTTVTLGEGAPLQGDAKAASVTYTGQSCKA